MGTIGFVLCPHLKGSMEGTVCYVTNSLIKDMGGFTVKLCMSQRHEACSVYMQSLHNMDLMQFTAGNPTLPPLTLRGGEEGL